MQEVYARVMPACRRRELANTLTRRRSAASGTAALLACLAR